MILQELIRTILQTRFVVLEDRISSRNIMLTMIHETIRKRNILNMHTKKPYQRGPVVVYVIGFVLCLGSNAASTSDVCLLQAKWR